VDGGKEEEEEDDEEEEEERRDGLSDEILSVPLRVFRIDAV
jgi:hypothetical protein